MRPIYANKKLNLDFEIVDKLEVGIQLLGWEVKSVKSGRLNMAGAFVDLDSNGSLQLKGARISSWESGEKQSEETQNRTRKLLAHAREASRFGGLAKQPGFTLVPAALYVNDKGLIKLEVSLVKGRRKYEKKQKIKERDMRRQFDQDLKRFKS